MAAKVPADLLIPATCETTERTRGIAATCSRPATRGTRWHLPPRDPTLNQLERFFAFVTQDLPQRSHHNTVPRLEADIRARIED